MLYSPLGRIDPNKIEFCRVNDIVANARNAGDETILPPWEYYERLEFPTLLTVVGCTAFVMTAIMFMANQTLDRQR